MRLQRAASVEQNGVCDCSDASITTTWPCGCGDTEDWGEQGEWHCSAGAYEGAVHLDGKHWGWDCAVAELLRRLSI